MLIQPMEENFISKPWNGFNKKHIDIENEFFKALRKTNDHLNRAKQVNFEIFSSLKNIFIKGLKIKFENIKSYLLINLKESFKKP
jgi:hypothetical protein